MEYIWTEQRQANPAQRIVTVGITSTPLVDWSEDRTALIISLMDEDTVWLSLTNPAVISRGIEIARAAGSPNPPLHLTLPLHGRLVRGPIFAIAGAAPSTVVIWESIHPCGCMHKGG